MILSLIALVPLCGAALWAFLRFSPKDENKRKSIVFYNSALVSIDILLCAIYSYKIYTALIDTRDSAWWPILSILGSLFTFSLVLLLGIIIRFFIFKKTETLLTRESS